jgi:hypothetical protein
MNDKTPQTFTENLNLMNSRFESILDGLSFGLDARYTPIISSHALAEIN